ncbi:hypothetical protein [Bradyrhizobium sp. WD16]|uniref:hypothetical protein n=1 Tax=Bradyrhizobium sp. WD16 TaxID=1521768 RepID=UPI0020A406AD|nr:hypothetical protein [Bradyrhizobium sp. WD16]UTD29269.1 hypothetical protein DB459_22530 [Bradyrhizobium sp. WD16]
MDDAAQPHAGSAPLGPAEAIAGDTDASVSSALGGDPARTLRIERVRTRAQLRDFIVLPRLIYDGLAGYVAPLDYERRQMLDPRHNSFFTHGHAAYWIATRNGRPLGRISAQIDHAAVGADASDIGLFGCLDAIDDGEVVKALFAEAESWLCQQGRRVARGPFLLSINGESGLLIEGQQEPPMTLLPWHPTYLDARVREAGYVLARSLFCFEYKKADVATEHRLDWLSTMQWRAGITTRDIRLDDLDADMEKARQIFNDGWKSNWGFTPTTQSDVRSLTRQFRPMLLSQAGFFIEVHGEPAAFMLAVPNLFDLTTGLGPAPSLLGWIKLLIRMKRAKYHSFRIILLGMTSKYRTGGLRTAIAAVMIEEMARRAAALGVDQAIAGWVLDNNPLSQSLMRIGLRKSHSYGVFEKTLID